MQSCPKCGSPRVHRSRSRGWVEKLRKAFTHKRPHRCHACGWRGWGAESVRGHGSEASGRPARRSPDFRAIDVAIGLEREAARRKSGG